MGPTIEEFWKLIVDSQLLSVEDAAQLGSEFGQVKGAIAQANSGTLCEWLVSQEKLTRYQAKILLAGRPGPFVHGQYLVEGRLKRIPSMFRAKHRPSEYPVSLQFLANDDGPETQAWPDIVRCVADWPRDSAHVVRCFEAVNVEDYRFVVYERPWTAPLSKQLDKGKSLKPTMVCQLSRHLAMALAELHQRGWVATDLRPLNVWLKPGQVPQAKLFQNVALCSTDAVKNLELTGSHAIQQAEYFPPEWAHGDKAPNAATDVYRLGCLMFRMLSGRSPFLGENAQETIQRHVVAPVPNLQPYGVSRELEDLVAGMLAKDPHQRLSASQVAQTLKGWVKTEWLHVQDQPHAESLAAYLSAIRTGSVTPPSSPDLAPVSITSPVPPPPVLAENLRVPANPTVPTSRMKINVDVDDASVDASRTEAGRSRLAPGNIHRRRKSWAWGAGVLLAATFVIFVGFWVAQSSQTIQQTINDDSPMTTGGPDGANGSHATRDTDGEFSDGTNPDSVAVSDPVRYEIVDDDGQQLWEPSTQGTPVNLSWVAPGAALLVHVRPSELLAMEEGRRLFQALGPAFQAGRTSWEISSGIHLEQVREVVIGFHANAGDMPRTSWVLRLSAPLDDSVVAGWGVASEADDGMGRLFRRGNQTILVPHQEKDPVVVMGSDDEIEAVLLNHGVAPALRNEWEQLVASSDRERHFTMVATPQFFFTDGKPLMEGHRAKMLDPLSWFWGDKLQAVATSIHLGDTFYWEYRAIAQLDHAPDKVAIRLEQRLEEIPRRVTEYFFSLDPLPYWRELALRYPFMIRELQQHARVGYEGNEVIANGYLPLYAAHNLVLGTELAMVSNARSSTATLSSTSPVEPMSLREYLKEKELDLEFSQQSLEFAIQDLQQELNDSQGPSVSIEIAGDDLKRDGITRNQQITNFQVDKMAVADVLTALARRANPVAGVDDPSSDDQKLVWVLVSDPNAANEKILFTTRKAALDKGYSLPHPFFSEKNVE